jgi:PAS domain S-box-containing protein
MNDELPKTTRRYAGTLRKYLRDGREADLERAYELGRMAVGLGLGVLDMARVHHAAVESLPPLPVGTGPAGAATTFFLEALSPFEATHRGFGETSAQLRHAIAALEKRNLELAGINRELQAEVSERRRTEKALQMSETRLLAILENSPTLIFLKDPKGRYLHVNRQFARLFGFKRGQILGRTDFDLFPRRQAAVFRANDRKVLRAGVALGFEETAHYQDGVHVSIVSKFPLRDTSGKIYALCGIATDITDRKRTWEALRQSDEHHRRLFNEARVMQENLRGLSNQILHVQEEERKHISRELHDDLGQSLTAISVTLAALKTDGTGDESVMRQRLARAQQILQEASETVHRFARELRPALLDELGLLPALRSCLNAFAERTGMSVRFRGNAVAEQLSSEQKTVLFRVAQESLTNVAKHSQATRVRLDLRELKGCICMEVADNGRSFSPTAVNRRNGNERLGLLGMQERVRLVSGSFAVQPRPGKGTSIRVAIPFEPPSQPHPDGLLRNGSTQNLVEPSSDRSPAENSGSQFTPYGQITNTAR